MSKTKWRSYIENLPDFPLINSPWERDFVRAVFENLPKKGIKKVLEVGCSNGRWLRWFHKEYNSQVYGIDSEPAGFKKKGIINFKKGDAKNLPYGDEFFDLVFSMGLVEHFKRKDKFQILKEQSRVLKKDGYLICQVPLLSVSLNYLYMKYAYDLRKGTRHFRTTERELKKYFQKLGLKVIFSQPTGCLIKNCSTCFAFLNKVLKTEILLIARK